MKKTFSLWLGCAALAVSGSTFAGSPGDPITFDISAHSLGEALRQLAIQADLNLVYYSDVGDGLQTRPLTGRYSPEAAVRLLLKNTSLHAEFVDEHTVLIRPGAADASKDAKEAGAQHSEKTGDALPSARTTRLASLVEPSVTRTEASSSDGSSSTEDEGSSEELEEVVVTGTNIHGVKESASPIRKIDKTEIDASGVTTVEDLFKNVPENVGGIDVDTFRAGVTGQAGAFNAGNASGVNLRGLGSDSTLVLLNGHRMPYASQGYSVDISTIPLEIIDHVDILKDGASSIYGSDAVAGVVNFVTLQRFSGALTTVTGGTVTSGGKRDIKLDQLLGTTWDSGSVLGSYTFNAQGALSTADRSATVSAITPADSIPPLVAHSLYLSAQQALVNSLDAHVEVLGSERRYNTLDSGTATLDDNLPGFYTDSNHIHNTSLVTNGALSWTLASWRAALSGQYSVATTDFDEGTACSGPCLLGGGPAYASYTFTDKGRNHGLDLTADGPLLDLPAGAVRAAMGVADRAESFQSDSGTITLAAPPVSTAYNSYLSRNIRSAYAEVFLPLIGNPDGSADGIPQKLEFTLSDRYDRYSDFGGTNNPKVGLLFEPTGDVGLRATYSTSFRAPLLAELATSRLNSADFVLEGPDAASPTGTSFQLFRAGDNPNLHAETAHSVTTGLDLHPRELSGLNVTVDYFLIHFKNRIEAPDQTSPYLAAYPALYGAFITRNPPLGLVESILNGPLFSNFSGQPFAPSDIVAIVDNRLTNVAVSEVDGIDLNATYLRALGAGKMTYALEASDLLKYDDTLVAAEAPIARLNTPYYPTKLRLRGSVGWSSETWSATLFANFVNRYTNNSDPTNVQPVGSWLTFDGQVSYRLPVFNRSETRLSLSVQNILDRQPPFVQNVFQNAGGGSDAAGFNYDPVNASLLGRYLSLRIRTRW